MTFNFQMTFLTSSLLKLPIKFDIARHLYDVICINELTHRVLQLVIAQHRIRLKLLCPVSIMKIFLSWSSLLFRNVPHLWNPNVLSRLQLLRCQLGKISQGIQGIFAFYHIAAFSVSERFITRLDNASFFLPFFSVVTEAADANQPEGKKEDEDTSASWSWLGGAHKWSLFLRVTKEPLLLIFLVTFFASFSGSSLSSLGTK